MIKTAVILAAGLGSRLKELTKEKPKGFLQIDESSIIEMSIKKLLAAGITNIIIGTGYKAEDYNNLALKYPQIKCALNDKYKTTGSMYTLYNLRDVISADFILLESDLIYYSLALGVLMHHEKSDVILASDLTNSHDEVFIETDENLKLKNMSKEKENLKSVYGELVGISKISIETYKTMCDYAETNFQSNLKLDYESVLIGVSIQTDIYVNKIKEFPWCEIDDDVHLKRAEKIVYPVIKSLEENLRPIKRNVLLNPGPATTTETVKYAQLVPDICPRENEFGNVMNFISRELTSFVGSNNEYNTVLFGGSGTAAVESILSSVVDGELLIINNGAYGRRMCQIAAIYGLKYTEFKSKCDEAIDLDLLEKTIKNHSGEISYLAVVHNETTTGLLNDINPIGELCKRYNIILIVDAMSSYAAIPIDMKIMNISYLASSANKNIQGLPGVSFVIANNNELEISKKVKPRSFYLNLYSQYKYFIENYQLRFTPPVQTLYALKQAIIETKLEGINNRYARYSKSWETLIAGINALGLTHLVKPENHSRIITAIIEPDRQNYNFNEMHDYFYSNGITIYPGKLEGMNTFRVANIGDITYKDMEKFVELLELYLRNK